MCFLSTKFPNAPAHPPPPPYTFLPVPKGHFEKYPNILKIVVWVVPHVNLTFALSLVHDLHGLSKICILRVFARTFRQRWPKYTFNIAFVFHYVQEFGNERSELEGVFNQR